MEPHSKLSKSGSLGDRPRRQYVVGTDDSQVIVLCSRWGITSKTWLDSTSYPP